MLNGLTEIDNISMVWELRAMRKKKVVSVRSHSYHHAYKLIRYITDRVKS